MNWLDHTAPLSLDPCSVDLGDRTYCIPCFGSPDRLVRSISTVGMLNPPVVQFRAGKPVPVLGRRRLLAARTLGLSTVRARVAPENMPESDGFVLAFWENVGHRSFDPACTAVIVRRLLELFPREVVATDFLPALGVPPKGPRLERLKAIGGLEEPALRALAVGRIMEKTALVLTQMTPEDRRVLLELIEDLGLNCNKTAEIVAHLFDLSVLHGRTIVQWLRDEAATAILANHEFTPAERAQRFRALVRSWKFPGAVDEEKAFRRSLQELPGIGRVSVRLVSGFEEEKCVVEIQAESWGEAEKVVKRLERIWE